jgi:hypothetical protein
MSGAGTLRPSRRDAMSDLLQNRTTMSQPFDHNSLSADRADLFRFAKECHVRIMLLTLHHASLTKPYRRGVALPRPPRLDRHAVIMLWHTAVDDVDCRTLLRHGRAFPASDHRLGHNVLYAGRASLAACRRTLCQIRK